MPSALSVNLATPVAGVFIGPDKLAMNCCCWADAESIKPFVAVAKINRVATNPIIPSTC
ncbi:MAG: hypothetical protein WBZ36_02160 [Candidatus Nitrosopolaris sp.]